MNNGQEKDGSFNIRRSELVQASSEEESVIQLYLYQTIFREL